MPAASEATEVKVTVEVPAISASFSLRRCEGEGASPAVWLKPELDTEGEIAISLEQLAAGLKALGINQADVAQAFQT